ncbi:phage portal protein [Bacillus velezensis]|uniref:phage portal protein n=1 Tax=Bacillus velezensis TaxID=492670 RepID=UPI002DBE1099|nr:phage portal protein [Bacillus velezensis]MEC3659229.1 phage portal protein [Bacillus velezensis]MEC3685467.1 phage portal protein [Bacillus velezensis]MEC3788417.1 phage portal protein [Bacillus velezensis]MEC3849294.1 phage portal protein [Bacillus velezensis]
MGFWGNVRSFFGGKTEAKAAVKKDLAHWFIPRASIFGNYGEQSLADNETVFSAVSRLSNTMASLPIKVYKNYQPVESEASNLITYAPNHNMTSGELIGLLETHRDTFGNGYAIKRYGMRYEVIGLEVLDPSRVQPIVEETTRELWYEVFGDNGNYFVHNMDMIHVKHVSIDGLKGISPLKVLRGALEFDRDVRTFSLEQMDGAKISFILELATQLDEPRKAKMLENFKSFYRDNGGILIQEQGVKIRELKKEFIDTKAFEVEKVTRSRVAQAFNIPLYMLGETQGSVSNMEQLYIDYVQGTLMPIATQYEKEFNRKLLTDQERKAGYYFKFSMNALLRGDMQTRGNFYQQGIRSGWFKPNEVRAWEDLPPEKGGDTLYLSKDLFPIDQVAQQKITSTDAPKPPTLSESDEGGENNKEVLGNQSGEE